MRRSSDGQYNIYNFTLPAYKPNAKFEVNNAPRFTCPQALNCIQGCYARQGAYLFSNVAKKHHANLDIALSPEFESVLQKDLDKAVKQSERKGQKCLIRIHDSGDFFGLDYTLTWFRVMRLNPNVQFYAYTKSVELFKDLRDHEDLNQPSNFSLIYSLGGKQDSLINLETDRHSRVFESLDDLLDAGYVDASHDDTVALGSNPKIGLVYHGGKKYSNTTWNKVKKD